MSDIEAMLRQIFGGEMPTVIQIGAYLLIGLLLLWVALFLLSHIKRLLVEILEPLFYQPEEKRRMLRRRRFAEHIEREIRRLNSLEEWRDYRFTELEAEVEAEGKQRIASFFPFLHRTRSGLRREKSLSKALKSSQERLILVEGDPGSGKSVALRHVALRMARKAMKSRSHHAVIPIYVNLKELVREQLGHQLEETRLSEQALTRLRHLVITHFNESELHDLCFDLSVDYENLAGNMKSDKARELINYCQRHDRIPRLLHMCRQLRPTVLWSLDGDDSSKNIDLNLIYAFVLKSLNRANDRDIEAFLDEEFSQGLKAGTWFFLFDSFDELPEVLSSTETDAVIRGYTDAISDFLHGLNHCRGIIASRQFRGPGQTGWPRFRILPLAETRRLELVKRADLKLEVEHELIGQLGTADQEIRAMSNNPLFLGLLCEHMRAGNDFPQNTYTVFETYVNNRLTRDKERLRRRFQVEPSAIRATAEGIAFAMAADTGLGLSPTRDKLAQALQRLHLHPGEYFHTQLDALEYIKLARSETTVIAGESKSFTFAHRRFQEYFATCVVLQQPDRVSPERLLTDARWRETAVTMCQIQPQNLLTPLLQEARKQLTEMLASVPHLLEIPTVPIKQGKARRMMGEGNLPQPFPWPSGALHLINLLQSGFGARLPDLPDDIRLHGGRLLLTASLTGTLSDKKWGLEVAGVVPADVLPLLLRDAFAFASVWLEEVAYRQAARLSEIPDDIARSIHKTLIRMFADGQLKHKRHETYAHLGRLDKADHFLSITQLLLWVGPLDLVMHTAVFVLFFIPLTQYLTVSVPLIAAAIAVSLFFSHRSLPQFAYFLTSLALEQGLLLTPIALGIAWRLSVLLLAVSMMLLSLSIGQYIFLLLPVLLLWSIFALLAAATGKFTRLYWWPFMPLWALFYTVWVVKELFATRFAILKGNLKQIFWGFILPGVVGILIVFVMAYLRPLFMMALVTLLIPAIVAFMRWAQDGVRWYRWVQGDKTLLSGEEFLLLVGQYHHQSFRNQLVKYIREQELLVPTRDTEILINKLATAVEHAKFIRHTKVEEALKNPTDISQIKRNIIDQGYILILGFRLSPTKMKAVLFDKTNHKLSSLQFLERWLAEYTGSERQRLWLLGPEFLDENYKLLEQIQMRNAQK